MPCQPLFFNVDLPQPWAWNLMSDAPQSLLYKNQSNTCRFERESATALVVRYRNYRAAVALNLDRPR